MNIPTKKSRSGFTLVELLVVIAIIVALAALATPQIFKALKRAALAEALNNVRQVKFALDDFALDFDGQYPNDDTAEAVSDNLAGGNAIDGQIGTDAFPLKGLAVGEDELILTNTAHRVASPMLTTWSPFQIVCRTLPRTVRPSKGVFVLRLAIAAAVIVHS